MIPNFFLGSQPSGIPVIIAWITFWFSTNQGFLYCLWIFLSLFPFLFISYFFHSTLMLSFSLPQIWLYEKLKLLYPPIVSPSQYQPKHYHDCKLKDKEMDPTKLTKLLKHLTYLDVQWVVEWWHIEAMSSCGFNENCVPLVRLRRYSYYPTCRIVR